MRVRLGKEVLIREQFNAWLEPLARPLTGVHPNVITVVSLATGCLAGLAYGLTRQEPAYFFAAGVLVALSGILDGFDGVVARVHGKASMFGDFLDHFFDRLVEVAIVGGLAVAVNASTWLGIVALILVLLNSYLGTQIHASFGSRDYSGIGKAQLFIALVLVSMVLGFAPHASLSIAGREVSGIDLFLVLVCAMTLQAMFHRVRLAARLAREREGT